MRCSRLVLSLFAFLIPALALAQGAPERTIVLAGHLLDVRTGDVRSNQAIVIEQDRIVSVSEAAKVDRSGAKVVDLSRAFVLPGLIDAHTHLTFDPVFGPAALTISNARAALIGAKNARITLEAGFTSVRNVGASGFTDTALRDAIDAGELPGPHMQASGPAIGRTGGHCDENQLPWEMHVSSDGVADGVPAILHRVRENIKYGATVIKLCATGGVMSQGDDPNASEYTKEEIAALVQDAHRLGRRVAAHAHGAQGIVWTAEAGVDSIEHGSYIDEEGIAAMKKHGTYLVPQIYIDEWLLQNAEKMHLPEYSLKKEQAMADAVKRNLSHAMQSGVKVAYGTDSGVLPHGMNAWELPAYVAAGLTPLQAIQSATINAADLMGWSKNTGAIEPGKWADIIAVDKNPLDDIRVLENVPFVMKSGVVYKSKGVPLP